MRAVRFSEGDLTLGDIGTVEVIVAPASWLDAAVHRIAKAAFPLRRFKN
jgi:hypothetical protein|tara:strand:+ start:30399 stop:30545 length:147 start_codon:yes stop_codon:yes gene_type:complete